MTWRLLAACLVAGMAGVGLALVLVHLYQDHVLVDAIRADLRQQATQGAAKGAE